MPTAAITTTGTMCTDVFVQYVGQQLSAKTQRCAFIHQLSSRLPSMLVKRGEQLTRQTGCSMCSTEDVCMTYWECHGRTI